MVTVITYGTYDLFHEGHRRLLERARALGDRLVVGVTSDAYDRSRGKLNVKQALPERIENVMRTGLVDQVLVEEYDGQKIHDIEKWGIDVFAIGSDWQGKFEYLRDYCDVVYLDRTRGVSSTELRNSESGILRVGLVGAGRAAENVVEESRFVSGIAVESVWAPKQKKSHRLAANYELERVAASYNELLSEVDAVYVSTRLPSRTAMVRTALEAGRHVLVEPPISLDAVEVRELLDLAASRELTLVEGIHTAFSPGFLRMVAYARSGSIGRIRSVHAVSTQLIPDHQRAPAPYGGALAELATYPLLAVVKLLGTNYQEVTCHALRTDPSQPEVFARIDLRYKSALASVSVGIGVKSEDDLRVSGDQGYLYVPSPWWITNHFETRFEDAHRNRSFYLPFEGSGQRYELEELASRVRGSEKRSYKLSKGDVATISEIIEEARTHAINIGEAPSQELVSSAVV